MASGSATVPSEPVLTPGQESMEKGTLSPLTGSYLLIVLAEPHSQEDRDTIIKRLTKGLRSWDLDSTHVDLSCELLNLANAAPESDEARNGEKLVQWASENLVVEVLVHCQVNTLLQCMKNLLSSFTRHRHIIHAGYTFQGSGSWILQDGTFSFTDFLELWDEPEIHRLLGAYRGDISLSIHCGEENGWTDDILGKESFSKLCQVCMNPEEKISGHSSGITSFVDYVSKLLIPAPLPNILEPSDIVGNIRFSHPTLYIFPGGQGDAALFGVTGFNMLIDGGFSRRSCFWDFTRHLDRLDAVLLTRVNNNAICGIDSLIQRKKLNTVYPQIGHFFGNLMERKDKEKEKEPGELLVSLTQSGYCLLQNLKSINLKPHHCFRDRILDPVNLYHKVGHGKLDMYVLNPVKDSKELKTFLSKWNTDCKSFVQAKMNLKVEGKELAYPVLNLVSICALLVWQPDNPKEPITRILFPGSTPQTKIFEALGKLRHLEFLKYPICSAKTIAACSKSRSKSERIVSEVRKSAEVMSEASAKGSRAPSESRVMSMSTSRYSAMSSSGTKKVSSSLKSDSSSTIQTFEENAKGRERSREKKIVASSRSHQMKDNKILEEVKKGEVKSRVDTGLGSTNARSRSKSKPKEKKEDVKSPPSGTATPPTKGKGVPNKYGIGASLSNKGKPTLSTTTAPKAAKEATNRKVISSTVSTTVKKAPEKVQTKEKSQIKQVPPVLAKTAPKPRPSSAAPQTNNSKKTTSGSNQAVAVKRPGTAGKAAVTVSAATAAATAAAVALSSKKQDENLIPPPKAGEPEMEKSMEEDSLEAMKLHQANESGPVTESSSEMSSLEPVIDYPEIERNGNGHTATESRPETELSEELASVSVSVSGSEDMIEVHRTAPESESHTITEPEPDAPSGYDEEDEYLVIERDESSAGKEDDFILPSESYLQEKDVVEEKNVVEELPPPPPYQEITQTKQMVEEMMMGTESKHKNDESITPDLTKHKEQTGHEMDKNLSKEEYYAELLTGRHVKEPEFGADANNDFEDKKETLIEALKDNVVLDVLKHEEEREHESQSHPHYEDDKQSVESGYSETDKRQYIGSLHEKQSLGSLSSVEDVKDDRRGSVSSLEGMQPIEDRKDSLTPTGDKPGMKIIGHEPEHESASGGRPSSSEIEIDTEILPSEALALAQIGECLITQEESEYEHERFAQNEKEGKTEQVPEDVNPQSRSDMTETTSEPPGSSMRTEELDLALEEHRRRLSAAQDIPPSSEEKVEIENEGSKEPQFGSVNEEVEGEMEEGNLHFKNELEHIDVETPLVERKESLPKEKDEEQIQIQAKRPVIIPSAISSKFPREKPEFVRTPDEVADLPVHEEVDIGIYDDQKQSWEHPELKSTQSVGESEAEAHVGTEVDKQLPREDKEEKEEHGFIGVSKMDAALSPVQESLLLGKEKPQEKEPEKPIPSIAETVITSVVITPSTPPVANITKDEEEFKYETTTTGVMKIEAEKVSDESSTSSALTEVQVKANKERQQDEDEDSGSKKIFFLPRDEDEEEDEEEDETEELPAEEKEQDLIGGVPHAVETGLITAASTLSAPIVEAAARALSPSDEEDESGHKSHILSEKHHHKECYQDLPSLEKQAILANTQEHEIKLLPDSDPINVKEEQEKSSLIQTAESAVTTAVKEASETVNVAHHTINEVEKSAISHLENQGENKIPQQIEDQICSSMKGSCNVKDHKHDEDDNVPEVVEEPCVKTQAPKPVIPSSFYDEDQTDSSGLEKKEEEIHLVLRKESPKDSSQIIEIKTKLEGIDDSQVKELESQMINVHVEKDVMDDVQPHEMMLEATKSQIYPEESEAKKPKTLSDYIGTIKEAQRVFANLLKIARSGAELSSAVDDCRMNAQEAIRRHLEAADDYYYIPARRDEVVDVPDSPEPEMGITVYENFEQMAKAGADLFTGLVEKVEKEIEEQKARKEAGIEEGPKERRSSAELAVTQALQHLHETFKVMQTMGSSPKRSSSDAAKRMMCMCPHHHHEQEQEEISTASSSAIGTTGGESAPCTLKSPEEEGDKESGTREYNLPESGVGSQSEGDDSDSLHPYRDDKSDEPSPKSKSEDTVISSSYVAGSDFEYKTETMEKTDRENHKECEEDGNSYFQKETESSSKSKETSEFMTKAETGADNMAEFLFQSDLKEDEKEAYSHTEFGSKDGTSKGETTSEEKKASSESNTLTMEEKNEQIGNASFMSSKLEEQVFSRYEDSSAQMYKEETTTVCGDGAFRRFSSVDEPSTQKQDEDHSKVPQTMSETCDYQGRDYHAFEDVKKLSEETSGLHGILEKQSAELRISRNADGSLNFDYIQGEEEPYSSGEFTDSQPSSLPPQQETDDQVNNFNPFVSSKDLDNGNFTGTTTGFENGNANQVTASNVQDQNKWVEKPLGLPVVYNGEDALGGSSETPKKPTSSRSTSKGRPTSRRATRHAPIYVDLTYIPHHGNPDYCDSEFFRMVRARYYVFSGLEPSREVFEGLLQGKREWEDKNLETTIIPTYDTDSLGYWVVDSEKELAEAKIDLAPSASRCTINLMNQPHQDQETSCAAYRLEF